MRRIRRLASRGGGPAQPVNWSAESYVGTNSPGCSRAQNTANAKANSCGPTGLRNHLGRRVRGQSWYLATAVLMSCLVVMPRVYQNKIMESYACSKKRSKSVVVVNKQSLVVIVFLYTPRNMYQDMYHDEIRSDFVVSTFSTFSTSFFTSPYVWNKNNCPYIT